MEISGTSGTKPTAATISNNSVNIVSKKESKKINLIFVAFQRVSKRLKTCDVIWVGKDTFCLQTIEYKLEEVIRDNCDVPIYDIGLDPAPWKKWHSTSVKEEWTMEDWEGLLIPDMESESDDSDWNPGEHSDIDDDMSDAELSDD